MLAEDFGAEQTGDRRGGFKETIVNETFEINHAKVFAHDINLPERKTANLGNLDTPLFQIHGERAEPCLASGDLHFANKRTVQQGREGARINHEASRRPVDRGVDIQVPILAQVHRHAAKPLEIHTGRPAWKFGIQFESESLPLAVEHRLSGQQNVSAQDTVDRRFIDQACRTTGTAKIDKDNGFINEVQGAKPQTARNRYTIESAVDANRFTCDSVEAKMLAAIFGNRADRRPRVHAEPSRLTINICTNEQMVLL